MDTVYVKEFIVLAEICNYSRAAEMLYISQSTLFNHIRSLETDIGVSLFSRKGRKIVLSESGQLFLPYAKTIVAASDEFSAVLQDNTKKKNSTLRIAIQYPVTDIIQQFRNKNPECDIYIQDSQAPTEMMEDGSCELAFLRDVSGETHPEYCIIPYTTDTVVAAIPVSHPLANRKVVTLAEMRSESFVMIAQRKKRDCYCMKLCKNAGFVPKIAMTAATGIEAVRLVDAGLGVSLFLKGTMMPEIFKNLRLLELEPEISCSISLCWLKDRPLSPSAAEFVRFVQEKQKAERD